MPAFDALDHYSPVLIILLGLATFAGLLGIGLRLMSLLRWTLPSPWRETVAALLGVATLSLIAQGIGIAGLGNGMLVGAWGAFVAAGWIEMLIRARSAPRIAALPAGSMNRGLIGLVAGGAVLNLLVAAAPSTKIDEIYYQTIVSERMVLDGILRFYLQPWPAAILPQMAYGIASAPLHAIGYPDAPNILSLCLSLLLAWFGARLVFLETRSAPLALVAAAAMQAGLYPSVFHTTGGPHALGDLATAAALLALVSREHLLRSCSPAAYLAILSTCCVVSASTKLSLVPLAGLIVLLGLVPMLRAEPRRWQRSVIAVALPWVIFYLPICVFTFWKSGSPFGPALAGVLAPSIYGEAVGDEMEGSRVVGQRGVLYAITDYAMHYPLLFALGAAAVLLLPSADPNRRRVLGGLLVVQATLVALLLPHMARFLSGLHHALLVAGLVQVGPLLQRRPAAPAVWAVAIGVLVLPWSGVQAYRTWYLGQVTLGLETEDDYLRSYVALHDDFRKLDDLLPEDAVLYSRQILPSIYFPRPVYMHRRDIPAGHRVFALLGTSPLPIEDHDCSYMRLPVTCRFGEPIYTNPEAHYMVFRRPGQAPQTARLEVREVLGL